jgi:heat shock protein HspQ
VAFGRPVSAPDAAEPRRRIREIIRESCVTGDREMRIAKYGIGQVVRHRVFPFRGVIFDVDPVFANTEEWWEAIPEEVRPSKDQPFYHLYAENDETEYVAYVSEQNLLPDDTGRPLRHPQIDEAFVRREDGSLEVRRRAVN